MHEINEERERLGEYLFSHGSCTPGDLYRTRTRAPAIFQLTLILRRSRTGTVWFYTSTSNKRAA